MGEVVKQYGLATLFSVALHLLVVFVLLWGWQAKVETKKIERPNYIQAKLVALEQKTQAKAKPIQKQQPNKIDLTKKKREAEAKKKADEQKRIMEIKRKKEKAVQEEKIRLKKAKEKKEKEEKARAEREKQEQAQRQARLEEQLQAEQDELNQALEAEEQRLAEQAYEEEAESFIGAISRRVEQNWSRPPSARNGMSCELLITLVPTGRVITVDVVKSSGNIQFDRSAERAVKKAEQFPEIKQMKPEVFERYYRQLTLVFTPQDLRL